MLENNYNSKVCPFLQSKIASNKEESIPVIVSMKSKVSYMKSEVCILCNRIKYELPIVNGYACDMNLSKIKNFYSNPDLDFISYDSPIHTSMNIASKCVKSDIVNDLGYTGKDITIATVDTGISPHRDLIYPTNRIVGFKDFIKNNNKTYDDNGHGTHIAGIIASSGISSRGKYKGIAPEANILGIKVLDKDGNGKVSDILSAIQWVIYTKDVFKTKILNLSLGTNAQYRERTDPLVKAANKAIEKGLIVVAAVGNNGPKQRTILSPATGRYVISVGACDDNRTIDLTKNTVATFSSRGPTKDRIKKPDLLAPGVNITSLSNKEYSGYTTLSGTSMAAPMVSGAIALLLQKTPTLTHLDIKKLLEKNCSRLGISQFEEGAGILDLSKLFKI
ncbi:S8 family peptidase [Sedimentibacter sp. zth1]|uniref:S8 family peptidase n=1 Tax=Sedimentibacter sp. zth1 TaxID=2816908 RepID=UPI001A938DA7|nr:S8 family peptidase [Sedimentibacter sp. zth1]QSX05027.1 S8 family peptidase [Sedimentibacter sp. zth1]